MRLPASRSTCLFHRLCAAGSITFAIADLPGKTLGRSFEHTVVIDCDAAGFGWFIDRTPRDDREFGVSHDASSTSAAYGHMDLLSVVAHEIGHLLGYDLDSTLDVMRGSVEAGHRTMTGMNRPREDVTTIAIDAFFQGIGSNHGEPVLNPFIHVGPFPRALRGECHWQNGCRPVDGQ